MTDTVLITLADQALQYASFGWPVLPLHAIENGHCSCNDAACSSPGKHPRNTHGLTNASTNPDQVDNWWKRWPDANIGIVTGAASGIVVVDIDPRHGGDDTWDDLVAQNGRIPDTLETMTGGGGRHIIFNYPGWKVPNDSLGKFFGRGVDLRGDGGYIVAPPSNHLSGKYYEWEASSDPVYQTPADMPAWMIQMIPRPVGQSQAQAPHPGGTGTIKAGSRNNALISRCGKLRRNGYGEDEILALMRVYNQKEVNPPLDDAELVKIVKSSMRYKPGKKEIPTDDELAEQWLNAFPLTRFGMGDYRRYENGIWIVTPEHVIRNEILAVLKDAKPDGVRPTDYARHSVQALAQHQITVADDLWDADPDILVCKNGALHIPTRELRPHDPEYYATSSLPFDYDPAATAPTWENLLERSLKDVREFLKEFAGYALTTDTRFEIALWLCGPRGSGKSTILAGLEAMLGKRAGVLGLADIEMSRFALTQLPGKTLMTSAEQPGGYMKATAIMNNIISGEKITVDRKFKEPVTITPRAKLAWAMNLPPRITDSSDGLFRRVKVIQFPPVAEGDRDPTVKEQIKLEGAGILNWALDGLAQLRKRAKFAIPRAVEAATAQFIKSNDVVAMFVSEKCKVEANAKVQGGDLYTVYKDWCFENGHKSKSSTSLAEDWHRLGFERKRSKGCTFYHGIRMLAPGEPADDDPIYL